MSDLSKFPVHRPPQPHAHADISYTMIVYDASNNRLESLCVDEVFSICSFSLVSSPSQRKPSYQSADVLPRRPKLDCRFPTSEVWLMILWLVVDCLVSYCTAALQRDTLSDNSRAITRRPQGIQVGSLQAKREKVPAVFSPSYYVLFTACDNHKDAAEEKARYFLS